MDESWMSFHITRSSRRAGVVGTNVKLETRLYNFLGENLIDFLIALPPVNIVVGEVW